MCFSQVRTKSNSKQSIAKLINPYVILFLFYRRLDHLVIEMALLYKISINNYIYVFEYRKLSYIIRFNVILIMASVVFCLFYDCQIKILFQ